VLYLFLRRRTLVVVSHRPATILWADRIFVVENGVIADSGKHRELMDRCEAYRRNWQFLDHDIPSGSSLSVNENVMRSETPRHTL